MHKYYLKALIEYAKVTNQMNKPVEEVISNLAEDEAEGWVDYQGGIL